MQEEDELRKEIAEKKKIMEKEFGSAPMNEQQFKGNESYFFDVLRFGAVRGVKHFLFKLIEANFQNKSRQNVRYIG